MTKPSSSPPLPTAGAHCSSRGAGDLVKSVLREPTNPLKLAKAAGKTSWSASTCLTCHLLPTMPHCICTVSGFCEGVWGSEEASDTKHLTDTSQTLPSADTSWASRCLAMEALLVGQHLLRPLFSTNFLIYSVCMPWGVSFQCALFA